MSVFYTNVFSRGDRIFVRGYRDGRRFAEIVNYKPYLFIPARKESRTEFRTLEGKPVEKLEFDSISDTREFLKRYDGVDNMEIHGLSNFPYLYIYDNYRGEINYDSSKINIISLDIETSTANKYKSMKNKTVKIRKKDKK